MLAGGDTTDVLTMKNVIDYSRYANNGQLQEINGVVDKVGKDNLAGIDAFDMDGKYFALPYRQDFWLLYYNKDLFKAAGIEDPKDLTWEKYTEIAKKLTTEADGKKVYGTYHHIWRSVVQAIAAAQNGADQNSGDYGFFADQYNTAAGPAEERGDLGLRHGQEPEDQLPHHVRDRPGRHDADGHLVHRRHPAGQEGRQVQRQLGLGAAAAEGRRRQGHHVRLAHGLRRKQERRALGRGQEVHRMGRRRGRRQGHLQDRRSPGPAERAVTDAYFKLDGMPTDELSKKAFTPDKTALEMPVSDKSACDGQILNQEHDLIMVGERSVADGIAEMGKRVKSEVLGQ